MLPGSKMRMEGLSSVLSFQEHLQNSTSLLSRSVRCRLLENVKIWYAFCFKF